MCKESAAEAAPMPSNMLRGGLNTNIEVLYVAVSTVCLLICALFVQHNKQKFYLYVRTIVTKNKERKVGEA